MVYFFWWTHEGSTAEALLINQPMSNYPFSILCVYRTRLCRQRFIRYCLCLQGLHLIEEHTQTQSQYSRLRVRVSSGYSEWHKRWLDGMGETDSQTTQLPSPTPPRVAAASPRVKDGRCSVSGDIGAHKRLRTRQQTRKSEIRGGIEDHGQK